MHKERISMDGQDRKMNAETRIKEVAERIIRLREDLGISVEEMAANTDYSVEDYKKAISVLLLFINARTCSTWRSPN